MSIMTALPVTAFTILVHSKAEPFYRQIMWQVQCLITSGEARPGDTMPSVRDMARTFGIHPMTVSKAYSLLQLQGLLKRRRGATLAIADRTDEDTDSAALVQPLLERAALDVVRLGFDSGSALVLFTAALERAKQGRAAAPQE